VFLGLCNSKGGLWNSWDIWDGLWNSGDGLGHWGCATLKKDSERTDCQTRIVQLWRRIVKLWGRIVKLGLCNSEGGLWNSGTDWATRIVHLWRRIVKLWGRIVKLRLWNSEDKLWKSGGRLWNWCCESLKRDGESLGGDGFTGIAHRWRQIRKLWNSKLHN
jgi:hypothetical protein